MSVTSSTRPRRNNLRSSNPNPTLFEYPNDTSNLEPSRSIITFTRHDQRQLRPPQFLNDTVISFVMQYHLDHHVSTDLKDRLHLFSSFFFAKINSIRTKNEPNSISYNFTSRWLRGIKIFDKDFLILPVCERDHWLLVVICYPANQPSSDTHLIPNDELYEPAVIVLNSCHGLAPPIKKTLNQFLKYQWEKERATDRLFAIQNAKSHGIRLIFPDVPQQKNNYDCGVFVLNYFKCFLRDPRKSYVKMFRRHSMKSWFQENKVDLAWERRRMITIIAEQIKAWAPERERREEEMANNNNAHSSQEIELLSSHSDSSVIDLADTEETVSSVGKSITITVTIN